MATAGTTVQRCGRAVKRRDRTPIRAHPSANPASMAPVMVASVCPAKTTRLSVSAVASPAPRDATTMRANGPCGAVTVVDAAGVVDGAVVGVDVHGGLALAVGWSSALERGRERVCSPRSDGRDACNEARLGLQVEPGELTRTPSPVRATADWSGQERSRWASSPREVTPVLVNTLRRWKATVRGDTQH